MKITKRQLKRIIKEEKAKLVKEYGIRMDDTAGNEQAIQIALDHLQKLDDALYNAGIEIGMGQMGGIVRAALDKGGY